MAKKVAGVLDIKINLDGPLVSLQAVLREAISKMSFAIGAVDSFKCESLQVPCFPQVSIGKVVPISDIRMALRPWLVGMLLQDCIEGLNPVLMDVWHVTKLLRLPNSEGLVHSQAHDRFLRARDNFDSLSLGQKVGNFRQEFPEVIPPAWIKPLRQLVGLRNCLVHRSGLVRKQDLTAEKTLTVTWRATELIVLHGVGKPTKISRPQALKRAGTLALQERWKRRSFKLGQRIEISPQEFAEIALSLFFFAIDLRSNWAELELKPRGLVAPDLDLSRKVELVVTTPDTGTERSNG